MTIFSVVLVQQLALQSIYNRYAYWSTNNIYSSIIQLKMGFGLWQRL